MKAPKAPDPVATAQAQAGVNLSTAVTQQNLNMVDQSNPWGTVDYSQNGTTRYKDSFGNWVEIPTFSQKTTFTPEQQAIFDKSQQAQTNLAGIASDQSERVAGALSDPFSFNNQDAADWSYDLASSRILPQQAKNEEAIRTRLINSGIQPGSQAWNSEMERLTMSNTDQMNQLALTGRGQAFQEALATRNQPLNELSALLSGSQVSNPAQMSSATPQTGVGGVDYSGLVSQKYQGDLANYQAKLGGLFGLAGAGAQMAMMSDERLKTDIQRVGALDNGLPVYLYRYKDGGPMQIGLLAQEVEAAHPEAVIEQLNGFKAVQYARAVQ